MINEVAYQNWPGGIDNKSRDNRLAEGHVRDMLNLDPGPVLRSRVGFEKLVAGSNVRAIMALGRRLLFVDGTALMEFDTATSTLQQLATVAGVGPVASAVLNSELFISTANETLRYDGTLRQWGVNDVTQQPSVAITNQRSGRRLYAMTYVNQYGEEGGTVSAANAPDGDYEFTVPQLPAGYKARIYVSALNGRTLYFQKEATAAGSLRVFNPVTDTATLGTMHMSAPAPAAHIADKDGVLVMGSGSVLNVTEPMWPHLVDRSKRFVAYPEEIGMVLSGLYGVYVSADKCYMIEGIETDSPRQKTVMDYPAFSGTGTILPSGAATWVTRYGMAVESGDSREGVLQPNDRFVVDNHERGVSGVVENDGEQRLVSVLKRSEGQGALAACDYFEAEVIRP